LFRKPHVELSGLLLHCILQTLICPLYVGSHINQENIFFVEELVYNKKSLLTWLQYVLYFRLLVVPLLSECNKLDSTILRYWLQSGASIPPKTTGAISPQSHRPSIFYGVRFQSMGKLQAPKARSCNCRRQEAPRD